MTSEGDLVWNTTFPGPVASITNPSLENNVDFKKVYTDFNLSYNEGYTKLGMENVVRPTLYAPGEKILGHCQRENSIILGNDVCDSPFFDMIQDLSKTYSNKKKA